MLQINCSRVWFVSILERRSSLDDLGRRTNRSGDIGEMKITCVSVIFYILAVASIAQSTPILDLFFGNTGGNKNYGRRPRTRHVSSEGGYNDYKRICSVVNPNPYAFIGSNPYPGVPFCPP